MRAVFLVLLLVVAGCAHRGTPTADTLAMPADFAGTVAYGNGSVPPPYHYQWEVTFDDRTAVVVWQPGYGEDAPWRETADITSDQRSHLYDRLSDLGVFDLTKVDDDGMVGGPGGHLEITADGRTYNPGSLGESEKSAALLKKVADAVKDLVPAGVWAGLQAKQDDWSARQPK